MVIAETAYSVVKAIASNTELQRFYDMIDRDREAAKKPPTKKQTNDSEEQQFWRQQIWQLLVDRRNRNIAKLNNNGKIPDRARQLTKKITG